MPHRNTAICSRVTALAAGARGVRAGRPSRAEQREALAFFERSNAINPRHIASASRVRPADKVAAMRAEVARLAAIEARLAEGIGVAAGAERHRRMAERLAAIGEAAAANGHRLRAIAAEPSSQR